MLTFRLSLLLVLLAAGTARAAEPKVSFNRDIRPILSDTCFQCHGPDDKQRKSGLRLDVREMALKPAKSGSAAIVPGHPEKSELMQRLTASDKDDLMPPSKLNKPLSPQQIETVKRWIAQGAEYQGHWAFTPIERPAPPNIEAALEAAKQPAALKTWPRNAIDHFVLNRMLREGLTPAAEASRETLIRRVSLDLTGLPPAPAEIDAFLADTSPQAYEKVVDRLLASPRYGERMALQWLDFARYADSNGFQVDSSRFQWPWRDWVIRAYNSNMPFDQFTIEQLAGDMLVEPGPPEPAAKDKSKAKAKAKGPRGPVPSYFKDGKQEEPDHWLDTTPISRVVATGFNRNHRLNGEGGLIAEEWRVETVIDRVETTGMTWLGLTFNCCRCHDHKYDPITQKNFYQFFSFFNNVPESGTLQGESRNTDPVVNVPLAEQETAIATLEKDLAAAQAKAAEARKDLPKLITAWEPELRKQFLTQKPAWNGLSPASVKSTGGATLTRLDDGSYLASGTNPANDTYEIVAPLPAGPFSGLLLECFVDASLPVQSLGRNGNGNFVLTKVEATINAPNLKKPLTANFTKAVADYSQPDWDISYALGKTGGKGWAVDGPTKKENRKAMFLVDAPLTAPANATVTIKLHHAAIANHNIGRFRLSATSQLPSAVTLDGVRFPDSLKQIVATPLTKRTDAQRAELEKYFLANVDSPVKQAEAAAVAAKAQIDALKGQAATVMVMREGPPRQSFVLTRGEYDKPGEKVEPGLPASLPPMPAGSPMNRLGLATWIVSPTNPLTARVWVNRAWERLFGTGIVKTSENFGSQAEFPTHPDLLDWLAAQFIAGDAQTGPWDMKAMQKLIVMSATYRQSSAVTPESLARDPENRLLSRGPRSRLSAEILRDQALYASGLLVEKVGGPSVRPYMPEGVWDETSRYGDLRGYMHDKGEGLHRKTIYTIWKRTAAPPSLLIFDAPSREVCTVKRSRTNTPLQALALLNEITYVEAARKLGERMVREGGAKDEERITWGFRMVTGRKASAEELSILTEGLAADLARFKKSPAEAARLLAFGEAKNGAGVDVAELAAYTLTANVLLNLDETVTRE
jgi:mono/diheme cytochrome c family protein